MNIFLEEEVVEIIVPLEKSEDRGVVITPTVGKRNEEISEVVKEITAMDAMMIGPTAASIINGVGKDNASKYSDGKDLEHNPEVKARIQSKRFDIQDIAVTKLMDTLNMLNPSEILKPRDQIAVITGLASTLDKLSEKGPEGNSVHLHLYAPGQRTEKEYKVIDV